MLLYSRQPQFYQSLYVLSPVLDLARDPRWRRTEETYGKDPYLVSQLGIAAIRGLQGERFTGDSEHLLATAKHFAAHGQSEAATNCGPVQSIVLEVIK